MIARALGIAWELPQTILGAAAYALFRGLGRITRTEIEDGRVVSEIEGDGAVSLGYFVFFSRHDGAWVPVGTENRRHEMGHARQSRMLGPLYLGVVGVPSVMRVLYARRFRERTGRRWAHYYDGFPENWADRLGGVDRRQRPDP